jgi:hypothetical protein
MNLKSGGIEGFEGYSQFKSVKEFNTHIEMWLAVKKHEFSKGELLGFRAFTMTSKINRWAKEDPAKQQVPIQNSSHELSRHHCEPTH